MTAVLSVSLWRRLAMLHALSFDYDEGVYWQSLESMQHGHVLFREVFSSQPPFFLGGLSPLYNLLGGGIVGGRLPVLVGSIASLPAIFLIGRALEGPWTGLMAMAFLAFDPLYLELSDRLQADLPCIAIGVIGIAVAAHAYRRGPGPMAWFCAGALVGLSMMTKLLGVAFLVPLAWLAVSSQTHRWRQLAAVGSGLLAAFAVVLGLYARDLGEVYRQAIGLHLGTRVSEPQTFGEKLNRIATSYPAVVPALAALVAGVAGAIRRVGWVGMLLAWLVTSLAIDLAQGPLFIHHLVVLAPPLALLAGAAPALLLRGGSAGSEAPAARPAARQLSTRTIGVALAATSLIAALGVVAMTSPPPRADASTAPAIAAIKTFVPAGVVVVTDEPFAAAYAGHQVPPNLVDQSHARITTGELTSARVEADTQAAGARAVIFSTGRLDSLTGFPEWVASHFRLVHDGGRGLQVWLRDHN